MKPLDFYREPVAPRHAALLDALPDDVASLAAAVPGLLLHQHVGPAHGAPVAAQRLAEAHRCRATNS